MEDQEAMDQQRMLNEEAFQEEQRRILEENAQRVSKDPWSGNHPGNY